MDLKSLKSNYIAVKPFVSDQMTPGGIIKPDTVEDSLRRGTVLKCGPGRFESGQFVETCVAPGDVVFFNRHSTEVLFEDHEHGPILIFRDVEVYGTCS